VIPHRIRIIRHEAVFEVRFADGRPSRYFYFDDVIARRLRLEIAHPRTGAVAGQGAAGAGEGRIDYPCDAGRRNTGFSSALRLLPPTPEP
jgi:hypothetical protein